MATSDYSLLLLADWMDGLNNQMLVSILKMLDCGESINQILLLAGALLLYSVFRFVCLKHKHTQASAVR